MALTVGSRLGHYTVDALVGEGGMGEVYRARDTKLDRDVALKVLPQAFTEDPDRLARFEREAKVLASLNHPGIAAIHGLEESEGIKALVLELVEGPTLADRIAKGPIPLDEALPIAKQIAEALEAAHEAGVIHRDLKPANIKVRDDGTVKVLDFGLAKALDPTPEGDPSQSPTLTAAATQMGVIMGTAAYMSPEQARGKVVDRRADVWALGAVIYEMLVGRPPFTGQDASDTLAAVLRIEPDVEALPSTTPERVKRVIRACLKKETKDRIRDVGDVALALDGVFDPVSSTAIETTPADGWQRRVIPMLAALALLAVGGVIGWAVSEPVPARVVRFSVPLVGSQNFDGGSRELVAIAPSGDHVVFAGTDGLWLRPLDQMEATLVSRTEGARSPFFSPDGQWLGFWVRSTEELQRVAISGGSPTVLGPAEYPNGVSWGLDGSVLFGQGDGVWRVSADGGDAERVIEIDEGERVHGPRLLENEHVLFTLRPADAQGWSDAQIVVQSLRSGERTVLVEGGRDAYYFPTGHLIYAVDGSLVAQAFSAQRLAVLGSPVSLIEGVRMSNADITGAAQFALSRDGTLVYVTGSGTEGHQLVWVDGEGKREVLDLPTRVYGMVRVSPDGRRVASMIVDGEGNQDIWILDTVRGTVERLTTDPTSDHHPAWSPDGSQLAFFSDGRDGGRGIFLQSAEGTGSPVRLTEGHHRELTWTPDGEQLVFIDVAESRQVAHLGVVSVVDGTVRTLLDVADHRNPAISPDGRWLAYEGDESGQKEIWVRPFPQVQTGRELLSIGGGRKPVWSRDGRALYFSRGQTFFRVTVTTGPPSEWGRPEAYFQASGDYDPSTNPRTFDIGPDGRFLILEEAQGSTSAINVVLKWDQVLKDRVPVP